MRRTRALLATAISAATLLGASRQATAYDPEHTHRWIARKAVEHLRALYPGQYDDVLPFLEDFVDGVSDEDNELLDGDTDPTTLRVMRHFFRPTDRAGLTMGGKTYPSSLEWATTSRDDNEWAYDDALAYWRAGETRDAFFAIGHVTHLIQDATVPAHTHLDIHGPPSGDSYEGYCSRQMRSDMDGDLPVPAADAAIPEFGSVEAIFLATARASYFRNMVPGALSDVDTAEADGTLAEMFPDIGIAWLTGDNAWSIPEVGKLGEGFFEYEPGLYYFKQAAAVGAIDRVAFDPSIPDAFNFGPNGDATMTENMARDLVPLAILHSAAVLKHFMDETKGIVMPPGDDPTPDEPGPGGCQAGGSGSTLAGLALIALSLLGLRRRFS